MLYLLKEPGLKTHYREDRKRKKAQHPDRFEPTTLRLRGASFTAVLQPLTHQKLVELK